MDSATRPRPILAAITSGGTLITAVGTLLAGLVAFGVLNSEQASAINNLVAAVLTVIPPATAVLVQLHILRTAEPQVTPVADPQDTDGTALVRPLAAPPK
ncbi:hypothetical protein [Kutzneria chonburiensis]|uniref:Holin n=1 Tax=Kutzneria chonburiensis TaxID=1483604 RepID=A0ABV6N3R5_9PSEU|nr:hypothetical protein [Kutzneria chonburiensis]